MTHYDVIVIGAGPAGLAAAAAAAPAGRVALVDAGPRPGGQFWRHRAGDPAYRKLYDGLSGVDYHPDSPVWFIEPGWTVHTRRSVLTAERLILATGAYDRTVPFPGWDLPGMVTAGGAQALLKGNGVAIGRNVVVAGTGPFLLPVATGLAAAGIRVKGVFEASAPTRYLRHLTKLQPGKMLEGLGYAARFARHRIPYRTRHAVIAAHGSSSVESVTVARLDRGGNLIAGTSRQIACDALAIGYGFTPQLELATMVGCRTTLDADNSLVVTVDAAQHTSVPGVYAAGELTGIGGSVLSIVEGRIAGRSAAGLPVSPADTRKALRLRRFASVLHTVHPVPAGWPTWAGADTLLCRCEEVPVSEVETAIAERGVVDGRGTKLMTRTGMGWCQGRTCGYATACLTARHLGRAVTPADLSPYATRPLAQPITLGDLAA